MQRSGKNADDRGFTTERIFRTIFFRSLTVPWNAPSRLDGGTRLGSSVIQNCDHCFMSLEFRSFASSHNYSWSFFDQAARRDPLSQTTMP